MSSPITLDDVRLLVAKADALSHATEEKFDNLGEPNRRNLEHVAHLASAAAEATSAALDAVDQLAALNAH
jgi:hypothetical protein